MTLSMSRFTVTGDDALDRLIKDQLDGVVAAVRERLPRDEVVALVLGGGYGRGEGGALATSAGLRPYNDYDLILVHTADSRGKLGETLSQINREQGQKCGIHVDITPLALSALPRLPQTLTWYELQQGHQVLIGEDDVLLALGARRLKSVPRSEFGRLLFNRGTGLLYCLWAHSGRESSLVAEEGFDSFATRQIEKAWLTLGDVFLHERGLYDSSVVKRREAFRVLGKSAPEWGPRYLESVEFKLSPRLCHQRAQLVDELARLCSLYVGRLGDYPAATVRPLVGLHATLTKLSPRKWPLSVPWRYPRERLNRALGAELGGDSNVRQRLIGEPADYIQLWERYA
jgi:hypothetical protein